MVASLVYTLMLIHKHTPEARMHTNTHTRTYIRTYTRLHPVPPAAPLLPSFSHSFSPILLMQYCVTCSRVFLSCSNADDYIQAKREVKQTKMAKKEAQKT